MRQASTLVGLALLALGCGRPPPPALPVVLGRYEVTRREAFVAAVTESMQRAGYPPLRANPASGRIDAALHTRFRGEAPPYLVVQLYREGWVTVRVDGVPTEARSVRLVRAEGEAEALALAIQDRLAERGVPLRGAP